MASSKQYERTRRRKWREENPERNRELSAKSNERLREIGYQRPYDPPKARARARVAHALRRKLLVRPETCQECGQSPAPRADGRTRIQAHHSDYSKPLDVLWLCQPCHRKLERID